MNKANPIDQFIAQIVEFEIDGEGPYRFISYSAPDDFYPVVELYKAVWDYTEVGDLENGPKLEGDITGWETMVTSVGNFLPTNATHDQCVALFNELTEVPDVDRSV